MFKLSKYLMVEKLDKLFLSFCLSLTFFLFIVIIGYLFNSKLYSEVDPELIAHFITIFAFLIFYIVVPILVIIELINFSRSLTSKHNSLFARLPISKVKIYFAHWISFFFSLLVITLNIVTFTVLAILLNNFVNGQQLLSVIFVESRNGVAIEQGYQVSSFIFSIPFLTLANFLNLSVFIAIFFQAINSSYLKGGLKALVIIGNIALVFISAFIKTILLFSWILRLFAIDYDGPDPLGGLVIVIILITLFVFMIRLFISIVLFVKEPR